MRRLIDIETAYENCGNAIIIQAAEDYKRAYKAVMSGKASYEMRARAEECEDFFESEWFKELTSIDEKRLMQKLREESRNVKKK